MQIARKRSFLKSDGMTLCDYIKFRGGYIDTGIWPTINTKLVIRSRAINELGTKGGVFFGVTGSNDNTDLRFFYADNNTIYGDFTNTRQYTTDIARTDFHTVILSKSLYKIDNRTVRSSTATTNPVPMSNVLIAAGVDIATSLFTIDQGDVVFAQIYENDVLVWDGIAAYKNGKYGFYDNVSENFFTSMNDSELLGPDVNNSLAVILFKVASFETQIDYEEAA